MVCFTSIPDLRACIAEWRKAGATVAFVPTMGALHEGHLSLVRLAREYADNVVVSIFVNPTQFGPNEDFSKYPRTEEADVAMCREAGVSAVFLPTAEEMYPKDASVYVDEERLSKGLCGASRPGHFRGVLTVVAKLFNIVQPDVAVFGQKDAQQVALIERMVRDMDIPVRIVRGATHREADGLAMSSRNRYLSAEERGRALCLSRALATAKDLAAHGTTDAEAVKDAMRHIINQARGEVGYLACVDTATLEPVERVGEGTLVAVAVTIGTTRLIDNIIL